MPNYENQTNFDQSVEGKPNTPQTRVTEASGSVALLGSGIKDPNNLPPAQTSHREGYWHKPTQGQIDRAAQYGFDLTEQGKY